MHSKLLSVAYALTSTASTLATFGFGVAKASMRLGFSIARGIASVAPIPLLSSSLDRLECLSLLPILVGESITSTSLDAVSNYFDENDEASFSLEAFVGMVRKEWAEHERAGRSVPEVARAVVAWATIQGFTKEWNEERMLKGTIELTQRDFNPPERVKRDAEEKRASLPRTVSRVSVTDDVVMPGQISQVISADIGEKVTPVNAKSSATAASTRKGSPVDSMGADLSVPLHTNYETWKTLRRLSKMVLAGYGGAGLILFGTHLQPADQKVKYPQSHVNGNRTPHASFPTDGQANDMEKDILIHVVEGAEAESPHLRSKDLPSLETASSRTSRHHTTSINPTQEHKPSDLSSFSWWNVLMGKHDREIFEGAFMPVDEFDKELMHSKGSRSPEPPSSCRCQSLRAHQGHSIINDLATKASECLQCLHKREGPKPPTAIIGDMRHMPRFWVLTDHGRQQVVLVVRGTMSFNELAVDLTCAPESFQPATAFSPACSKPVDDYFTYSRDSSPYPNSDSPHRHHWTAKVNGDAKPNGETEDYQVHGGMLRLTRAMGSKGRPVHQAVSAALSRNPDYELILCGHSLGAGVAGLLALMWADPITCRTVPASGLPPNLRVSVYCFAPPCITSPALSRLCENLITSIVYSFDVVSRLSLGSIQDLNRAAFWLCEGQGEESTVSVLRRALKDTLGFGDTLEDTKVEQEWYIEVRKKLEAKMYCADLFPPGKVWWALRNESLHPSHQSHKGNGEGVRLYEVQKVEEVFKYLEFKGDMISSHLPHQYDRMLTELGF